MLPLYDFVLAGVAFLAIGLAGTAASRHFVITILSIELIFAGSIAALVGYFDYSVASGLFFPILLSIWAVASVEIIALVAFYVYMKDKVGDFDLRRLMQMKG
ncbi:MAG: hypothetical protein KGH54_03350 [Candidatus Micrarchaeota archaeon]|nr:hypothetical protein [Candidatus Micrarchaeota archaeon]